MRRFLLSIIKGSLIGALLGLLALAILTGGSGNALTAGAIMGGIPGALVGLNLWARAGGRPSPIIGYDQSALGYGAYDSGIHAGAFDGGGFDGGGMDAGGFDGGGI